LNGLIFDIKEFGLHDGAGLRTTVFFKGCPLSCRWCHNPEGISPSPELLCNLSRCTHCGLCQKKCTHPECAPFGRCIRICPQDNLHIAGHYMTPQALAARLMENEEFLRFGGVTFSGGEPLLQGNFILELLPLLPGIRTGIETCGCAAPDLFDRVTRKLDQIYIDCKLFDETAHKHWTGLSNRIILENIVCLMKQNRPFTVRTPLIPGVTDTDRNLSAIADFLSPAADRVRVELIPYNPMTGAKYASVGKTYTPPFDEKAGLNKNTALFTDRGISCIAY